MNLRIVRPTKKPPAEVASAGAPSREAGGTFEEDLLPPADLCGRRNHTDTVRLEASFQKLKMPGP